VLGRSVAGSYVAHNSYAVHADWRTIESLCDSAEHEFVLHCAFVSARMKVERSLLLATTDDSLVDVDATRAPRSLLVTLEPRASVDAWTAQSKLASASADSALVELVAAAGDASRVRLQLRDGADWAAARRAALWAASLPLSHWVEPMPHSQPLHNVFATGAVHVGPTTGNTPTVVSQYGGQGVTVAVLDTGVSKASCYLGAAKFAGYEKIGAGDDADGPLGHGTAIASVCCGNGGAQNGVAKDASVFVADLSSGDDIVGDVNIRAALDAAVKGGASVGVVAFGDSSSKWYPAVAADIDAFAAANPNFLVVAAVGNAGYSGQPGVAAPAYAKNALVVGATQNAVEAFLEINAAATPSLLEWARKYRTSVGSGVVAAFSAYGPTADGRRKPDVVAPGEYVNTAALTGCGEREVKGTSVAAGAVAGAAASVAQWLQATRKDQPVSAALLKALLIHSAQEPFSHAVAPDAESNERVVGAGAWPSNVYGYGAVALDYIIGGRQGSTVAPFFIDIVDGQVGAGETVRQCYAAVGDGRVRATLVWTDPSGSPMAGRALVNDLNLVAWRGTDGFAWRGNHAEEYDSLNNVEAVQFDAVAGQYGVAVTGHTVAAGKQNYALVVTGAGLSKTTCSAACPVGCNAPNGACLGGTCMCSGGAQGADCGALVCPGGCGGNGKCDTATATCTCGRGWSGPDCTTSAPPTTTIVTTINKKVTDTGISDGLFIGLLILAYFVGLFCFLLVGGFVGARLLQAKRDRQYRR
jgi:hypothetical protein